MQNPDQKNNFKFGWIIFVIVIIFILVVGGLPVLLFLGIFAFSTLAKINKALQKHGYKLKDIFSKDGLKIIKDSMEKLGRKEENEDNEIINNLEQTDETQIKKDDDFYNYDGNPWKTFDSSLSKLGGVQKDIPDASKVVKGILISLVIFIAIPMIILFFDGEYYWNGNLDIIKFREFFYNSFLGSSEISRIIIAILLLFIIIKVSRDYFKSSKK